MRTIGVLEPRAGVAKNGKVHILEAVNAATAVGRVAEETGCDRSELRLITLEDHRES